MMQKLKRFFKNLKYLFKTDLSKCPAIKGPDIKSPDIDIVELVDTILYFLPNSSVVRPNVLDKYQTVDLLCNTNKSLARLGDGEILIIYGLYAIFQKQDKRLAERLRLVLKNQNANLLVGINHWYFYPCHDSCKNDWGTDFVIRQMPKIRKKLLPLLDMSSVYCDTTISDITREKNETSESFWNKMKQIWDKRDVVLVGCPQAHQKLKFNVFENATSEHWVYIPNMDAFDQYDVILERIKKFPKDFLVILMAGPTGTILAYDLSNDGYRALDLGHVAKAYDLYMRDVEITSEVESDFWKPDF